MLLVTVKKKCGLLKVWTKCGWFAKGLGKRWMVYFLKQKVHVIRLQLVYKKGKLRLLVMIQCQLLVLHTNIFRLPIPI